MKDQIMLKLSLSVVLLFIGIATSNATSYPPSEDWDFLGTKNIGHYLDKDVIYVRSSKALYSSIEVRTDRPNVNLHKCVIYFKDGDKQRVNLKKDRWGGEAHSINLYGGARAIDKIEILGSRDYSKVLRVFDKGTVEIWGKLAGNSSSYNNRYDDYSNYDYRRNDYYNSRDRGQQAREQAQRDRERAQRDRERRQRDRERAQRDRERDRDRAQRDRDRDRDRRGGVCPPRGGW